MNPLHWRRKYQVAWIAFCTVGGMAGLFYAWTVAVHPCCAPNDWHRFFLWLSSPSRYWPWPFFGIVFPGLIFYAAVLARSIADDVRSAARVDSDLASLRFALLKIAARCTDDKTAKELRELLGKEG